MNRFIYLLFVAVMMCVNGSYAQTPVAQTAKERAAREKAWQSCSGGYYTGPRTGRRNYSNDQYLWVVTPAFAERFCMPETLVSTELKGAEAIAFKMVDGADSDRCGVNSDGSTHCTENSVARFEIYLPQSLNLPAAHPEVKFFDNERNTSDWNLSNIKERISKSSQYEKGLYQIPPGRMPRYGNPYVHPDPGYRFGLVYAHEGKGRWPVSPLSEVGFIGDWVQGMDMLILAYPISGRFSWAQDNAKAEHLSVDVGQLIIVMDPRNNRKKDSQMKVPDDYAHVIYLPKTFADKVREANSGGLDWSHVLETLRQR